MSMCRYIFPSMIVSVVVVTPSIACAEDRNSVASGFFRKNMVNEMFTPQESASEENTESGSSVANISGIAESAKQPDSFEVTDGVDSSRQIRESDDSELGARVNNPHDVSRSLKQGAAAIEQLKRDLKNDFQIDQRTMDISTLIESARAASNARQIETQPQPRAMFGSIAVSSPLAVDEQGEKQEVTSASLIFAAVSEEQFNRQMTQVRQILSQGIVPLTKLYVVGLDQIQKEVALARAATEDFNQDHSRLQFEEPLLKLFDDLNPSLVGTASLRSLQVDYGTAQLPIWVVQVGRKKHVFPGTQEPSALFRSDGIFIAADRAIVDGEGTSSEIVLHRPTEYRPQIVLVSGSDTLPDRVLIFDIKGPTKLNRAQLSPPSELVTEGSSIDAFPACTRDQVRRVKVPALMTINNGAIDAVFYSKYSASDINSARIWHGAAIEYETGRVTSLGGSAVSIEQQNVFKRLARSLQVRCVPTRFHFVNINESRYLEYREGPGAAWDNSEKIAGD